jgi:hypothetical protein
VKRPKSASNIVRTAIVLLWVFLFITLLQRDYLVKRLDVGEARIIQQAQQESYLGVYFRDERIGYVRNRFSPGGGSSVLLDQQARLYLNILGEIHPVNMDMVAHLDSGFLLRDFQFSLQSPFYVMEASGEVSGNIVQFSLSTGKETVHDRIQLRDAPFLATNQKGYLLKKHFGKGEKIRIPFFDPVSLSAKETVLEYRGVEKILIKGRVNQLHHFVEIFSGLKINSWLDEEGQVIKEESPSGFVFLREPKFKATDIKSSPREMLSSVSVVPTGVFPADLGTRTEMNYRLDLPGETEVFDLAGGRQQFDGEVVTVNREAGQAAETDCAASGHLASTLYIQAGNPRIVALSKKLTGNASGGLQKAKILARWVYDNLEKRPVLGIPDALATLDSRKGDCNEHAALFAALARSINIPTRLAAGVMFHEGAFYYHAWDEVCLEGRWISLDTTRNQWPADLTHIRFVTGEVDKQIKISNLIGNLRIEVLQSGPKDMPAGKTSQ